MQIYFFGIGDTILIGQEIFCLPYAGFFIVVTIGTLWEIQCLLYAPFFWYLI